MTGETVGGRGADEDEEGVGIAASTDRCAETDTRESLDELDEGGFGFGPFC